MFFLPHAKLSKQTRCIIRTVPLANDSRPTQCSTRLCKLGKSITLPLHVRYLTYPTYLYFLIRTQCLPFDLAYIGLVYNCPHIIHIFIMSTFTTRKSSEFKSYPFLTAEEFGEVCHHLDRKYCQAFLGPVRQQWRLNVLTALDTSFAFGEDYKTYLQIVRPLTRELELDDGGLSDQLGGFSLENQQAENWLAGDQGMIDLEDADEVGRHISPARLLQQQDQ